MVNCGLESQISGLRAETETLKFKVKSLLADHSNEKVVAECQSQIATL